MDNGGVIFFAPVSLHVAVSQQTNFSFVDIEHPALERHSAHAECLYLMRNTSVKAADDCLHFCGIMHRSDCHRCQESTGTVGHDEQVPHIATEFRGAVFDDRESFQNIRNLSKNVRFWNEAIVWSKHQIAVLRHSDAKVAVLLFPPRNQPAAMNVDENRQRLIGNCGRCKDIHRQAEALAYGDCFDCHIVSVFQNRLLTDDLLNMNTLFFRRILNKIHEFTLLR